MKREAGTFLFCSLIKVDVRQLPQAAQRPVDGAGDGGFVDVQLLGNLRDGKPLEIAQLHHLPLPLGQLCLDRAVQKAAVLRALAAVGPALKAAEQVGKLVGVVEWNLLSRRVPPIISNILCAL